MPARHLRGRHSRPRASPSGPEELGQGHRRVGEGRDVEQAGVDRHQPRALGGGGHGPGVERLLVEPVEEVAVPQPGPHAHEDVAVGHAGEHAPVGPPGLGRLHGPRVLEPPQGGEAEHQVVAHGQRLGPGGGVGPVDQVDLGVEAERPPLGLHRLQPLPVDVEQAHPHPPPGEEHGVEAGDSHHPEQGCVQDAGGVGGSDGGLEHLVEGEALVDGAQPLVGIVEVPPPVEPDGGGHASVVAGLEPGHGAGRLRALPFVRLPRQPRADGRHAGLQRHVGRPPQLLGGPGRGVGPVAGGDVDAVGAQRRLPRQSRRLPGPSTTLPTPRSAPRARRTGRGRPAPSASSPRMWRMGAASGPPRR